MIFKLSISLDIEHKKRLLIDCIDKNYRYKVKEGVFVISKGLLKCLVTLSKNNIQFKYNILTKRSFYPLIINFINRLKDAANDSNFLEINNLYKKYKGNNFYSLDDVNLKLKKGEVIGLLGHNGAGKSTLIKSLVGQEEISKGSVSVMGINNFKNPDIYKSFFGYIPDHYILLDDFTGREYVNYIADLYNVDNNSRRKYINYYLRCFRLTNSFDAKISTYSFGMKQKITIIASLICQPKIWLLDEPLTGLDPDSIVQIKQCIKEHAEKGNIVLFSSHLIDVVEELANKIIILKKGKVIYSESKKTAMRNYNNNLNNLYMEKVGGNN